MDTIEDRAANTIIDCIVEFRVRYGYARKLDDPELHTQIVTLLPQIYDNTTGEERQSGAETEKPEM